MRLTDKCALFKDSPVSPYTATSAISIEVFREFVSALEDKELSITNANFPYLSLLCEEFGFSAFVPLRR